MFVGGWFGGGGVIVRLMLAGKFVEVGRVPGIGFDPLRGALRARACAYCVIAYVLVGSFEQALAKRLFRLGNAAKTRYENLLFS